MSNSVLLDKSKVLALEVIRLCNEIKTNKKESILTNQLYGQERVLKMLYELKMQREYIDASLTF